MKLEQAPARVILNVCCGKRYRDNMVNIDVVALEDRKPPDYLAPMNKIPLPDNCADELMCIHGWEHQHPWECEATLIEWTRLLKPGGQLTLEMPDVIKCAKNLLSGYTHSGKDPVQWSYWGLYGDPNTKDQYMMHKWGWEPRTLRALLTKHGLVNIREETTEWHPGGREHRDFRMVSNKPAAR
jgi:hypothetical protein